MNDKIKRIFKVTAAVLLALLCAAGCTGLKGCAGCSDDKQGELVPIDLTEQTQAPEPSVEPTVLETPVPEFVSMRTLDGFVRANKTGTYGVATDGSVRFMGMSSNGQNLIYDWANVVDLELNDTTTAALMRDSSIKITGFYKTAFADSAAWTGVVDIAMGDRHLVGLRTDGTVTACGNDSAGQCDVTEWSGVKKVVAAGDFTAALTEDGVLTTLGEQIDALVNAAPVADLDASPDRLVLLLTDGTVTIVPVGQQEKTASSGEGSKEASLGDSKSGGSSREGSRDDSGRSSDPGKSIATDPADWKGIVKVFAAKGAAYAIDSEGRLYTDANVVTEQIDDAYCVAASEGHAVVLRGNGKCVGFGANECLQCNVSGWRLLPYCTDEGWLLGYGPGTYIGLEPIRTGLETVYTDPATGRTQDAVFVILGDVNGDGLIDDADLAAVNAHIDGTQKLEGAFLRAANIVADSSKPDSIDVVDVEKLTAQAAGKNVIDQFAKTDRYTAPLADAKRKNQDALGYITIDGTNISYPIMYDLNWFYNDHDIDRKEVVRGSIYFYWSKANRNIVITGHNSRTSGTMFHQLHKVQDNKAKLLDYSNRLWAINTYGRTDYWEVWALYEEPAFKNASQSSQLYNTCWPNTFNAMNEQERQAWIDYQKSKNELKYAVSVTTEDRFLTLLTCGDNHADSAKGARLYIFLRWVGND